jgi:hypothetical protein
VSDSPIIQDRKLVGAVAHVLVANPTEGYGIFILPASFAALRRDFVLCSVFRALPSAEEFFSSVKDGINHRSARWMTDTEFLQTSDACDFNEIRNGLCFCPRRITSGGISDDLLTLTKRFMKPLPIETVDTEGYTHTVILPEKAPFIILYFKKKYRT